MHHIGEHGQFGVEPSVYEFSDLRFMGITVRSGNGSCGDKRFIFPGTVCSVEVCLYRPVEYFSGPCPVDSPVANHPETGVTEAGGLGPAVKPVLSGKPVKTGQSFGGEHSTASALACEASG